MMKQHAEQVSSLRAENRKLGAKIERQADLLSATIQVKYVVGSDHMLSAVFKRFAS